MTSERKHIAKWGFGMAPISQRMRQRYDDAVQQLCDMVAGNLSIQEVVPEFLSEAKGMMNRCVREDQWDWHTVFSELGSPPRRVLRQIVSHLVSLRRVTLAGDEKAYAGCIRRLVSTEILQLLHVYQNDLSNQTFSEGAGWVYILSTRESPKILKIGRTDRSVSERVREINSATGILVPWAARRTYRVRNASEAEAEIHRRLGEYRIRKDREFFEVPIGRAVEIINDYLDESDQRDRWSGSILWFDKNRGFGFLSCAGHPDVFLHRSQLSREDQEAAKKEMPITFLLGRRPQGACAIDAKIVTTDKDRQQGAPADTDNPCR